MGERDAEPKRDREEGEEEKMEGKRRRQQQQQSPYLHILSSLLLEEEEEEEGGEIFASLMSALERELCSSTGESSDRTEEGFDAAGVMRHLFDASDDELGIPPPGSPATAVAAAAEEEALLPAVVEGGNCGRRIWRRMGSSGCYAHNDDESLLLHADIFL